MYEKEGGQWAIYFKYLDFFAPAVQDANGSCSCIALLWREIFLLFGFLMVFISIAFKYLQTVMR